jgi:hypothetical protein
MIQLNFCISSDSEEYFVIFVDDIFSYGFNFK